MHEQIDYYEEQKVTVRLMPRVFQSQEGSLG